MVQVAAVAVAEVFRVQLARLRAVAAVAAVAVRKHGSTRQTYPPELVSRSRLLVVLAVLAGLRGLALLV